MRKMFNILSMGEIRRLPVEVGSLYHHLHWLYISQVVVWNFFHQPYTFLGGGLWCTTCSPKNQRMFWWKGFVLSELSRHRVWYIIRIYLCVNVRPSETNRCDLDKRICWKHPSLASWFVSQLQSFRVSNQFLSLRVGEGPGCALRWNIALMSNLKRL